MAKVGRNEIPRARYDISADDFVGLAACELWKRHYPERPSVEMLEAWMQEGYVPYTEHRYAEAAGMWLKLWEVLRDRFAPSMTSFEDADQLVAGTQSVGNWIQDFVLALRNASPDEPRYAERGVEVLQRTLDQFVDQKPRGRVIDITDLAFFHYRLGHDEVGEGILLDVINEHPDEPAGYACLSDELADHRHGEDHPRDLKRAISLLEQAIARPVKDPESWDLERRLEYLRDKEASSLEGDAGDAT